MCGVERGDTCAGGLAFNWSARGTDDNRFRGGGEAEGDGYLCLLRRDFERFGGKAGGQDFDLIAFSGRLAEGGDSFGGRGLRC